MFRFVRRVLGRLHARSRPRQAEGEPTEGDGRPRDRPSDLLRASAASRSEITDRGVSKVQEAAERTSAALDRATDAVRGAAGRASDRVQAVWKPEDPERILAESQLFEPLPDEMDGVAPELLSLKWRNEALLALSSAGVLTLEDEIIRHTDRLFHAGLPTPALSEDLFGRDFGELHRWIDTVPGSDVVGGGITHRVEHGHDLEAAAEIYREHGLEGVLVWTQHVGQDLFSSTGLPVPVGGEELVDVLVEEGIASRGNAALLVSFNAAELAAGFLAGAFALRLAVLLREARRRRQVKKRCAAAHRAWRRGDLDAVVDNYSEARSLSDDPALSVALGWVYREMARPAAESFLEFRRAALELASEDRMIELDGVAVSLRGLAYLLALVEAPQILQREDLRGAWREELDRMVNGAVASFEAAAISQSERPGVSVGESRLEWRPRPLSAAANYYLAARSVAAVPFADPSAGLDRVRTRAVGMLREAGEEVAEAERARLDAVATRWEGALAGEVGLLAS